MLSTSFILLLIFSPFSLSYESFPTRGECLYEAQHRIGTKLEVKYWDSMNGSNPIPTVVAALCSEGEIKK